MPLLLAIILIEGFVTISVEILTMRQLLPFVGNNVVVTSLIIGVFLLFLALGYLRGGHIEKDYASRLRKNFIIAQWLIGIGLSYCFCLLFFKLGSVVFLKMNAVILLVYLLLVIAPIVYILGQTVPITTNLFRSENRVGKISGKVLFLSTIGSFLGSVLTSLILFNFFGVAATVVLNVFLLAGLSLFLLEKKFSSSFGLFGIALSLIFAFYLNIFVEKQWFLKTNQYANLTVIKDYPLLNEVGDVFLINHTLSSFITKDNKTAPYLEYIRTRLFNELQLQHKNILVLGAGGFTFSAAGTNDNQVTYVDIDPDLASIVKKYYLPEIKGDFIVEDARTYLKNKTSSFDVIILDTYNSTYALPEYLLTLEYMNQIYQSLQTNGFAVFNMIINPFLSDQYSKRVDNTITKVFGNCMKNPLTYQDSYTNVIYFCHKSAVQDNITYSDNLNASTLDFFFKQNETR